MFWIILSIIFAVAVLGPWAFDFFNRNSLHDNGWETIHSTRKDQ